MHRFRGATSSLPTAATCFFTIKLPEYDSEQELSAKLRLAIAACTAIDTDGRGGDFEQMRVGGETDREATAALAGL